MILFSLVLIALALVGAPSFAIIGASAMWGFMQADIPQVVMGIELYRIAEMPILLAIPLFTFAGYVLSESQAPSRLVRLSNALLGWMPGGLAVVCLATCALFSAFTGASGVTIIALGALLYPALIEGGYREGFSLGVVTSSGSLGLLFAPSLPLILYGVVSQASIDDLFRAGVTPGILMVVMLSIWCIWSSRKNRKAVKQFSWGEVRQALREAGWEIPLPIVVLGGIYSGYFAVSEAAAVTALYVLILYLLIRREIKLVEMPRIMRESMVLVGGIMMILGVSIASTSLMIDLEVPQKMLAAINSHVSGQVSFLLLMLLFLLVLGAILDIFSALVLIVPLLLPVAQSYGIHPLHFGIIFLATMELGYLTPPVGLNLFISSYRFDKPITSVYLATIPFFLILLLSVLVITFVPQLSLWLVPD